jgi:hypothetical protein
MQRRSISFIASGGFTIHINPHSTLTEAQILLRLVPFGELEDLASVLTAHPEIHHYPPISLF